LTSAIKKNYILQSQLDFPQPTPTHDERDVYLDEICPYRNKSAQHMELDPHGHLVVSFSDMFRSVLFHPNLTFISLLSAATPPRFKFDQLGRIIFVLGRTAISIDPGSRDEKWFGYGSLHSPRDVVEDKEGNYIVVDTYGLMVFDTKSKDRDFPKKQIFYPQNTLISPIYVDLNNGDIIGIDSPNSKIWIYDGAWDRSFGEEGDRDGQFIDPCAIAVDHNSNILVADCNRIQIFTASGQFLMKMGGNGELKNPKSFVLDREGNIRVIDESNKLLTFG
jgi:DNA-binding beta-propeller fold protein YncE